MSDQYTEWVPGGKSKRFKTDSEMAASRALEVQEEIVPTSSLAVQLDDRALQQQHEQRLALNQFVNKELRKDIDFGKIPGTAKDCLYQPGAQKIANLFQLGMRIVSENRDMDLAKGWAMFTYRIELVHLPTGKAVSQCEGSANSQERKYRTRPAADMINTLQKMAQKRAYVGAVITACMASDFFTQDLEDMDLREKPMTADQYEENRDGKAPQREPGDEKDVKASDYKFTFGQFNGLHIWEIEPARLKTWFEFWSRKTNNLRGSMLDAFQHVQVHMLEQNLQ